VIADSFWQAKTARDALRVNWDEGKHGEASAQVTMMQDFRERGKSPGARACGRMATPRVRWPARQRRSKRVYEVPYLSHLMMEPLNCVVDLRADSCEVWTGSQFQTVDRANAARIAGLPTEKVQLHTTFLGGGFGRRANPQSDFVVEATHVAKARWGSNQSNLDARRRYAGRLVSSGISARH
jgi:isoquinoline 1-oxidoreductase subunit beta